MDSQHIQDVDHTQDDLSSSLNGQVGHKDADITDVIHLQAVSGDISSIESETVSNDFHSVTEGLHEMQAQIADVTSNIQITDDGHITCGCSQERNHVSVHSFHI